MLYSLLYNLHDWFSPLNVFRYITFRTSLAVLSAMFFSLLLGPWIIRKLKKFSMTQQIRDNGPESHMGKAGTPTMGGLLIILCILLSIFMWGDLQNIYIWIMILSLLGFGAIGFLDDYLKIIRQNHQGLRAYQKFGMQIILALFIGVFLYVNPKDPYTDVLSVPFFKKWLFDLGMFYIPFSVIVSAG